MFRNGFLTGLLVLVAFFGKTQNLVPNPSFEDKINCPVNLGEAKYNSYWNNLNKISRSTDFFHRCSGNGTVVSIPSNGHGYQEPRSGNGYVGIIVMSSTTNVGEYIGVQLTSALNSSNKYKVTFYASLSNNSQYSISNLGAYLAIENPDTNGTTYSRLDFYDAQIVNSIKNTLTDTGGWQKIEGIYTAKGGEKYIAIGNFELDINTNFSLFNDKAQYSYAYYYIDDVSVIKLPDQDISADSIYYTPTCSDSAFLQLRFQNQGAKALDFTKDTVVFSTEVKLNGAVVRNFDTELNSNSNNPVPNTPLAPDSFMTVKIGPVDLSSYGSNYQITVSSFSVRDSNSSNDTLVFDMVPKYHEECFKLIIPNVFTPNGDGVNDTFYFQNAENKKLHTQILNRWGEEVANWSGNQGWDGAELPSGVYYYLVKEMNNETIVKTHKGKVSILR